MSNRLTFLLTIATKIIVVLPIERFKAVIYFRIKAFFYFSILTDSNLYFFESSTKLFFNIYIDKC
jgi:hypothetical protein